MMADFPTPDGSIPIDPAEPSEIAHAALRGAIAAMAMSGMRTLTVEFGLVDETPPNAILRQRGRGALKRIPRRRRRAVIELAHWSYGAVGGALFGLLPSAVRRRRKWVGPIYGLAIWGGYELGIAPALGLQQAKERRIGERLAFAVDHLLYGFILSEIRARPQR